MEQKGCKKRSRSTRDQLIINKCILMDCRSKRTSLTMAWIDKVPHLWIMKCLDLAGAANSGASSWCGHEDLENEPNWKWDQPGNGQHRTRYFQGQFSVSATVCSCTDPYIDGVEEGKRRVHDDKGQM